MPVFSAVSALLPDAVVNAQLDDEADRQATIP
jgi:hypothetical protein